MHRGIATVSLSGVLADKLDAIADAGFDGIEIFDNDLIASPLSPAEVARRCAELGLTIDLFQPVRDIEGVDPRRFPDVLHRVRRKLEVMNELGATTFLACSNALPTAIDDPDLSAEQLHAVGELAAAHGVTFAYEALAWGRHVNRVGQAWELVQRAGHPAVTLAVDTFHMLARGDDGRALTGVPGERIGFLQVADAPVLEMNVLEWSRHFRCFPGQGMLDVSGVVAAVLDAGYDGPLSLEIFSDVVREADPHVTARDAMRSLLFLEDRLGARLTGPAREKVTVAPPVPARTDAAFVELADPDRADYPALLTGLGFHIAGRHRSKPVVWWRNGGANVVLNEEPAPGPAATALGLVAPDVTAVAERAANLLWPAVDRTRGEGEAGLPGITSPSGLHVFVSAEPGDADHWQNDFVPGDVADTPGWLGLDHVDVTVAADDLNQELSFFRTLFGLRPEDPEEYIQPQGRLRIRALRAEKGDLRVALNVSETGTIPQRRGVTQLAFATADVVDAVRLARSRGVEFLRPPANYYADLDARFALDPELFTVLQSNGLLYDRNDDGGEFLHAYTLPVQGGFQVELLERRGGYTGYGAPNAHVRLAAARAGSAVA
ncbi:sugar phosphate isomerase/epimerase and 4-hydroxyphenylpyruvate domain-containing protein [Rhodococcus sp. Z13]|uniref:Sugar phosphate isomerase/epimerase and 4-hydroxyphenylpyruvate domain-containing protein n=1 Tax=Rhodococcus sacchari TaxID=2962047 RepID=A0ACD4DDT8_9NOCA|nr:sugar phosphate isomerase/epimerase and 4-hydroxyphenylpyruvate domain-containing protein [Rhodococcus sp. Z13]UYP18242.1 sugar phosphate isomerase/epimerase and 4-hydroxyphenylpyruvate domain-containing protein [Rhodococcus sp. Z13]